MSGKGYMDDKSNPFEDGGKSPIPPTLREIDETIYGRVGSGKVPRIDKRWAEAIDIKTIRPDLAQPRRVVPMAVRGGWRGDAVGAGDVLARWWRESEKLLGATIDLKARLEQMGDGGDVENIHPIADEFLALVSLAGSIRRDGLVNPITVIRTKEGYMIEGGERRWWAYVLLSLHVDSEKYKAIPAMVVDGKDAIWRQAAENGVRRPLNAIGTARQLALLIMDMWRGRDGVEFNEYGFFDHDQEFYAQVKNGQAFSILKGQMERVLTVTGLKSKAQVAHYRALLSIPADIWDDADMQNWTEGRIREIMQNTRQIDERFTVVNLSNQNGGLTPVNPETKPSPFQQFVQPQIGLKNEPYGGQSATPPPPSQPPTKPSPLQYRPAPVPLDEDDIVMMDDGGDDEPIINHPFNGGFDVEMRPSDLEVEIPRDTRYVDTNSELALLIASMVRRGMDNHQDVSDWVAMRDFDRVSLIKKIHELSADEITQMVTNWRDMVYGVLNAIDTQMVAVLDEIWEEVQNG